MHDEIGKTILLCVEYVLEIARKPVSLFGNAVLYVMPD